MNSPGSQFLSGNSDSEQIKSFLVSIFLQQTRGQDGRKSGPRDGFTPVLQEDTYQKRRIYITNIRTF